MTAGRRSWAQRSRTSDSSSHWALCSRPRRRLPRKPSRKKVDVVGPSSLAAGHLTLVPALRTALDRLGRKKMPIVIGGVIPPQDYDEMYKDGVSAIFGPGTVIPESALKVLQIPETQGTSSRTPG